MLTLREKVGWFAFYSRMVLIVSSTFLNWLIPDHEADAFLSPTDPNEEKNVIDNAISFVFGGLVRWDGQYFMHIASYGYTYENCLAFFPLFPMAMRISSIVLSCISRGIIARSSCIILSGVIINVICFVLSAVTLYDLSMKVLKSKELAYKASILFCINPASIFFTAPYSEALFSYLSFYGMMKIEENRTIDASVVFGLAGATRSNALLNIGFILYNQLQEIVKPFTSNYLSKGYKPKVFTKSLWKSFLGFFILCSATFISLIPFIAFQTYGYFKFCFFSDNHLPVPDFLLVHSQQNGFVLPGGNAATNESSHWCKATLPLAYSYIQSHYWNVGFLKYYEFKQIPNFMLALPLVVIIISQSIRFIRQHPRYCYRLGFFTASSKDNDDRKKIGKNNTICLWKFPAEMLVYVSHALFLTVFCVMCIHVQVTTRLIASACPVFYWFVAFLFLPSTNGNGNNFGAITSQFRKISNSKSSKEFDSRIESVENLYSRWRVNLLEQIPNDSQPKFVMYYFVLYYFVGAAMFTNFLPWT